MGQIADAAIYGAACSKCLTPFKDEELSTVKFGVPVVCHHCWNTLEESEKKFYSKVHVDVPYKTHSEFDDGHNVRDIRAEKFENIWLLKFKERFGKAFYYDEKKYCYTLDLAVSKHNSIIDFYPKANKALIRKQNEWIKPALRWLISEYLQTPPEN